MTFQFRCKSCDQIHEGVLVEVSQSDHPLHIEQCNGITQERLVEIYETVIHGASGNAG
jgi:hypothetical protein